VRALEQLGADVYAMNTDFTGLDINVQCGSTNLTPLKQFVEETGADVGIAHDGDADRVMLVDGQGNEIDGDVVEAVCAVDLKERGLLADNTVVSTVMSNLGFMKAMEANGITVIQTNVGDKYVLGKLREGGYTIGGEQSGHMIFLDHNSTGDGLLTALQFLAAVLRQGCTVSEAAQVMERFPQELVNVRVSDKHAVMANEVVKAIIAEKEREMAGSGRVLVRASGTEPLVRVMVEAPTTEEAAVVAASIAEVIRQEMGA
jgi:phosphoglucosamine mutase